MSHVIDCAGDLPGGGRRLGSYNPNWVGLADSGRVAAPCSLRLTSGYQRVTIRHVISLVNSNARSTIQDSELPLSEGPSKPKLCRISTSEKCIRNSFRIRTCRKRVGGGVVC